MNNGFTWDHRAYMLRLLGHAAIYLGIGHRRSSFGVNLNGKHQFES